MSHLVDLHLLFGVKIYVLLPIVMLSAVDFLHSAHALGGGHYRHKRDNLFIVKAHLYTNARACVQIINYYYRL